MLLGVATKARHCSQRLGKMQRPCTKFLTATDLFGDILHTEKQVMLSITVLRNITDVYTIHMAWTDLSAAFLIRQCR